MVLFEVKNVIEDEETPNGIIVFYDFFKGQYQWSFKFPNTITVQELDDFGNNKVEEIKLMQEQILLAQQYVQQAPYEEVTYPDGTTEEVLI